jgi:hypothetical protein
MGCAQSDGGGSGRAIGPKALLCTHLPTQPRRRPKLARPPAPALPLHSKPHSLLLPLPPPPHAFSSSRDGDGGHLNGGAPDDNHGEALFVLAKLGCSSRTFHRISLPPLTLAAPVQGIQGAPPRKRPLPHQGWLSTLFSFLFVHGTSVMFLPFQYSYVRQK